MLEAVAEFMEHQGLGVRGRTIFTRHMPPQVKKGILLMEPLSGVPVDPDLPNYYKTRMNLILRDQTHESGMARAEQVFALLQLRERQLTGAIMKYMHPRHRPVAFPISEGDNLEISINFDVVYVAT